MESEKKREFYNNKARFDYQVLDSFEAGIVLTGPEIKCIREGRIDITTSYVKLMNGELFWLGANFNLESGDKQRTRKLLVHKEEIDRLIGKTEEKGNALLPLKLYLKRGRAKLEVGLGRGMKKYDKRQKIKERDIERDTIHRLGK